MTTSFRAPLASNLVSRVLGNEVALSLRARSIPLYSPPSVYPDTFSLVISPFIFSIRHFHRLLTTKTVSFTLSVWNWHFPPCCAFLLKNIPQYCLFLPIAFASQPVTTVRFLEVTMTFILVCIMLALPSSQVLLPSSDHASNKVINTTSCTQFQNWRVYFQVIITYY